MCDPRELQSTWPEHCLPGGHFTHFICFLGIVLPFLPFLPLAIYLWLSMWEGTLLWDTLPFLMWSSHTPRVLNLSHAMYDISVMLSYVIVQCMYICIPVIYILGGLYFVSIFPWIYPTFQNMLGTAGWTTPLVGSIPTWDPLRAPLLVQSTVHHILYGDSPFLLLEIGMFITVLTLE